MSDREPAASVPPSPEVRRAEAEAAAALAATVEKPRDRFATYILLVLGALHVASMLGSLIDPVPTYNAVYEASGIEAQFQNLPAAATWGMIAVVTLIAGYAITVRGALRRMRRGVASWWIPVVGMILTMIPISIMLAIPLAGDPAFLEFSTVPAP